MLPGTELVWAGDVPLAWGLLAWGLTLVSGLGDPLAVTSGAFPDVPVASRATPHLPLASGALPHLPLAWAAPPDGVGVTEGVGWPEDVESPDGDVGWPSPPEGGVLVGPAGDLEPALGLGETLGVWCGRCVFAGEEDGAGEDGVGDSIGGEIAAEAGVLVAPFEFGAAGAVGDVVGGVGPLVHGGWKLVAAVVWALAGLPELKLL